MLEYRLATYSDAYPFQFSKKKNAILLHDQLTQKQRLYVYLLLCANLPHISNSYHYDITHIFEVVCVGKMKSLLPANGRV